MKPVVMVDSMILSYLEAATAVGYQPQDDPTHLRDERIAAVRLFLWDELAVGEPAIRQCRAISDPETRARLDSFVGALMAPFARYSQETEGVVTLRAAEMLTLHADPKDCRVVAEAEALGAAVLVTFDKRLRNRLAGSSKVKILFPTERWTELEIPRGMRPRVLPEGSNPLAHENWWRWD